VGGSCVISTLRRKRKKLRNGGNHTKTEGESSREEEKSFDELELDRIYLIRPTDVLWGWKAAKDTLMGKLTNTLPVLHARQHVGMLTIPHLLFNLNVITRELFVRSLPKCGRHAF
jgi:hypothetical protein